MIFGKYTVVLKSLMESEEVKPLLDKALSTYPLYVPESNDEEVLKLIPTREELNKKILNHYKYREIGFETVGRFLDELEIAMNDLMPVYNQLYKSVEIMTLIDDPFGNVDVTETYEEERKDNTTSTNEANSSTSASDSSSTNTSVNSTGRNVSSTMPQGQLNITSIDNLDHADSSSWSEAGSNNTATTSANSSGSTESTSEGSVTSSGTIKHTFHKKGNQGVSTYARDMNELRETFIDVTNQIINDSRLRELFIQIY